jgi:hypothetical protein
LGIKPEYLTTFLDADVNRTDYMVIDLRESEGSISHLRSCEQVLTTHTAQADFHETKDQQQIRGAKHMPLRDSHKEGYISYMALGRMDTPEATAKAKRYAKHSSVGTQVSLLIKLRTIVHGNICSKRRISHWQILRTRNMSSFTVSKAQTALLGRRQDMQSMWPSLVKISSSSKGDGTPTSRVKTIRVRFVPA